MLDFNKKKNILKVLGERGSKNAFMYVPCKIAAAFVKLFYFTAAQSDIALSDKNGRFLGIEPRDKHTRRKQDEIVYVKHSLAARFLSLVLVLSFGAAFVPITEMTAFAADNYVLDAATGLYYDSTLTATAPDIDASACVNGYGAYKLAWTYSGSTTEISGFAVYSRASNGSEVLVSSNLAATAKSYIFTGLTPSLSYTLSVRSIRKIPLYKKVFDTDAAGNTLTTYQYIAASGTYQLFSSAASNTGNPSNALAAPEVTVEYKATGSTDSVKKVFITLDSATTGADGYLVYRRNVDKNASDALIATVPLSSVSGSALYTDESTLDKTTLYSYVVVAYKDIFGLYGTSAYKAANDAYYVKSPTTNNYHEILTDTATPSGLKVNSNSETEISLSWTKVTNASGYYVYRYTDEEFKAAGSSFSVDDAHKIASLAEAVTSYTDTEISNKVTYHYFVSAYRKIDNSGNDHESLATGATGALNTSVTAPQSFIGTPSDGLVVLSWTNTDSTVKGYEIDIKRLSDKDGYAVNENAITVSVASSPYNHVSLLNGETYQYTIRAYKVINNVRYYSDNVGPRTVTVGSYFGTPQSVSAVLGSDGTATVKWNAVKDAVGYYVHISYTDSLGNTTVLPVRDVDSTSYTQSGLISGCTYKYYVTAYKYVNGTQVLGGNSEIVSINSTYYIEAPKDISAAAKDNSVTVSWTAVKDATAYTLYATNTTTGVSLSPVDTTKATYTYNSLSNGTWSFYVTAYKTINGQHITSASSSTANAYIGQTIAAPTDVAAVGTDGVITVSWTAVKNAEGYVVYETIGGSTNQINVSKNTYTHSGLTNGTTASYYVVAYRTVNNALVYSTPSATVSAAASSKLPTPADFTVNTTEATAVPSWTAVKGAEGYIVYASKSGSSTQFVVSKNSYTHSGLTAGDSWTYYVRAYKTVGGSTVYSDPTTPITVTIGSALGAPADFAAVGGDGYVDLSWSAIKGAEGYVVYLYNSETNNYDPLTVVTATKYSHKNLTNGKKYTYMVVAFKNSNGKTVYGNYSLAASAVPSVDGKGSAGSEIDSVLNVKGTAPYGITHGELISAAANHGAFDESADAYFTINSDSTQTVKDILKQYGNGLKDFIVYPFDISIYKANTLIQIEPNYGYSVTFTMPIPDKLVSYRDYITVMHVASSGAEVIYGDDNEDDGIEVVYGDNGEEITEDTPVPNDAGNNTGDDDEGGSIGRTTFEVLPSALLKINGVWCIRFQTASCSPFAFVIYKKSLTDDVSSGAGSAASGSPVGSFNVQTLLFTFAPDFMPAAKKFRLVKTRKIYRVKRLSLNND